MIKCGKNKRVQLKVVENEVDHLKLLKCGRHTISVMCGRRTTNVVYGGPTTDVVHGIWCTYHQCCMW